MATKSLSREILQGTFDNVLKLINQGIDVNERDPFGLTPLIQATIVDNIDIASALLAKGAKIDLKDISGQTALQWAVNRRNRRFVELFLEHHANPNHYSADGQPILVNPVLRGEQETIDLLVKYGADQQFPLDYITAKLIGHRYELKGKADIVNPNGQFIELDYEGFYLEFTVGLILRTLINFHNSAKASSFSAYETVIQKIIRTLKDASVLIQYKFMTQGYEEHRNTIRELLNKELSVIPVAFEGHAITFINYKNLFAKCDRGVKRIVDTVITYKVGNPYALNVDFLIDLLYTNKSNKYINEDIKEILKLSPFSTLPARYQLSGNCSWANVEASVPAMMFMLMFRGNEENRGEIAALRKSVMEYYDTWVEWDKDRVLDECIANFYQVDHVKKACLASMLGAILLQRCRPWVPTEVARAKKIINLLVIPEYQYILKGYINTYCNKSSGKMGEDFTRLLHIVGLDFNNLTLKNKF